MKKLIPLFVLMWMFYSCSKTIDLDLPAFEPKLVVECYLEPGRPFTCLLSETMEFTATPGISLINDALVIIGHNGEADTLQPKQGAIDLLTGRAYNYGSTAIMPEDYQAVYTLYIRDSRGRVITGTTKLLPRVPIDTVYYEVEDNGESRLYFQITDPGNIDNYYRHITTRLQYNDSARTDWMINDKTFNGETFAFFTFNNDYQPGDTALSLLFNIPKDYYDFLRSVDDAENANGNPFGQPSVIKSNIQGGIGIFTALSYDSWLSVTP